MKRSFFTLFVVAVLSVSVVHASPSGDSGFTDVSVSPLYRLPDRDITVKWSTASRKGISIVYGDTLIALGSEGKYIIPASELSSMPESFYIRVIVNSKDGEKKKVKIQTFTKPRKITMSGKQEGFTERFIVNFNSEEWDSNLVIQEVELDYPQVYFLGQPFPNRRSREIFTKWEYYNSTRENSGYLRLDNQYESTRGFPAPAKGVWTFFLWNYPWHAGVRDYWPNEMSPDVIFTIGSKEE
jgi:hypothetical protein